MAALLLAQAAEPPALAVDPAAPVAPASATPAAKTVTLPAGSEVQVELASVIGSNISKLSERFAIRLAEPIVVDGVTVVAAGATGEGEIIDVAKAGWAGKQGKLIVSARHLDLNGQRARIRGMTWTKSGESQVNTAIGVSLFVPLAVFFVEGGDIQIPPGTRATVKLAQDVTLPIGPSATPQEP